MAEFVKSECVEYRWTLASASILVPQVKLQPGALAFYSRVPTGLPAVPFSVQVAADVPGKAVENSTGI